MSPEQWNRMVELFHAAREKTDAERIALLDSIGSDDPALRQALEQMLKDDQSSCSLLDRPEVEKLVSAGALGSTPASAGAKFGRYEVAAPIGRGGMGEIWAARDIELRRNVALKFLFSRPGFGLLAERLTEEARAASALNHPNIVTVHEVIWHEDTPIIVMELVEGQALRALSRTSQPMEKVVQIGLQAARALAAAHAAGIVHCDIKPENILVRRDGYVKVLDFGLARRFENEPAGQIAGTLRYMAPEQARGEPLSAAADVYALGLVLKELVFAPSHSSDGPAVGIRQLKLLVESMLATDPVARPSMQSVADALAGIARASDAPIPERNSAVSTAKWLAPILLILAAVVSAWLWMHREDTKQSAFYQVTTLVPENRATAAAISPDGKRAAYANVDGIFIREIQSGEIKALLSPSEYVADSLAWLPKRMGLIASGFSTVTNVPAIWFVSATGALPQLLRTAGRQATPSPDGKRIAFVTQSRSEIWLMDTSGAHARRVIAGDPGETFPVVFWAPDGRRLGVQDRRYSPDRKTWDVDLERFYERRFEVFDVATGRLLASARDLPFNSASWLPDGRVLFLGWNPDASDFVEKLFEVKTNSRTGAFLSRPRKIAAPITELETHIEGMTSTPDGSVVMVLKQSNQNAVFTGDFDQSAPRISNIRRLTLDERTSYPHAWTRDNRAVIFESIRRGTWDLFRQDIDQRTAEPIVATPLMEVLPQVGPDGHWVLYASTKSDPSPTAKLMRVPVSGGSPKEVPIGGPLDEFRCALGFGKRCVVRFSVRDQYRAYYDLDPVRGRGRELARTRWFPQALGDWDVSPDGNYIAIGIRDAREARIRILALEPRLHEPKARDLMLPGLTDVSDAVWSANGKAWFVSMHTTVGNRLLYVYPDGTFRSLGDIQGFAVPSPDGRRIAFLDRIVATNAWIIDRR